MLHARDVTVIGLTRGEMGIKWGGGEEKRKRNGIRDVSYEFLECSSGLETIDETISRKEGGREGLGALASGAPDTVSWTVRSFLRSSSWSTVSFLLSFNPSSPVEGRAAGQAATSASFNDHYWNFYLPLNWKLVVVYRARLPLLFTPCRSLFFPYPTIQRQQFFPSPPPIISLHKISSPFKLYIRWLIYRFNSNKVSKNCNRRKERKVENSARSSKRASVRCGEFARKEEGEGKRLKASWLVHLCTRLRSSDSPNGISPTSARSPSAPPPLCASALGNTAACT